MGCLFVAVALLLALLLCGVGIGKAIGITILFFVGFVGVIFAVIIACAAMLQAIANKLS